MSLDHPGTIAPVSIAFSDDAGAESVFGRLVYFASLRDEAGRYVHPGLGAALGEASTHEAIRAAHEQAFDEWLSLSIDGQKSDLDLYLSGFDGARKKAVFLYWSRIEPHRGVLPDRVEDSARALYLAGFEALLDAFAAEYGED